MQPSSGAFQQDHGDSCKLHIQFQLLSARLQCGQPVLANLAWAAQLHASLQLLLEAVFLLRMGEAKIS